MYLLTQILTQPAVAVCEFVLTNTRTDTHQLFSPETDIRVSFFTIRGYQLPRRKNVLTLAKFSFSHPLPPFVPSPPIFPSLSLFPALSVFVCSRHFVRFFVSFQRHLFSKFCRIFNGQLKKNILFISVYFVQNLVNSGIQLSLDLYSRCVTFFLIYTKSSFYLDKK